MRRQARWLAPALAIAALALAPADGWAAANDECYAGSDRGFGGTGHADERGFGGTGHADERGFGGTGFFGTVTGFGSICVNGRAVDYDASTRIERDGVRQDVTALRAGQTVLVDTLPVEDGFRATRVEVQPVVSGTVTRVDAAADRVEVLLQDVDVSSAVQRASGLSTADIRPGDRIAVHGLRGPDGDIVATRLERAGEAAPASVTGRVRVLPDGGRAIGRLRVEGDLAAAAGERPVHVTGRWVAGDGAIAAALARPALDFAPGTRQASVEAWVEARSGSRLATPELAIETAHATVTPGSPEVGSRVWAFGALTPSGELDARWVEVDAIGGGAPLLPDLEQGGSRGEGSREAGHVGEAREAEHAEHESEGHEVEGGAEAGEEHEFEAGEEIEGAESEGEEIEDAGEVEDLSDVDYGEMPETEEVDLPDIDDGAPEIDDDGFVDVDVDAGADVELPDVDEDLPEVDD